MKSSQAVIMLRLMCSALSRIGNADHWNWCAGPDDWPQMMSDESESVQFKTYVLSAAESMRDLKITHSKECALWSFAQRNVWFHKFNLLSSITDWWHHRLWRHLLWTCFVSNQPWSKIWIFYFINDAFIYLKGPHFIIVYILYIYNIFNLLYIFHFNVPLQPTCYNVI